MGGEENKPVTDGILAKHRLEEARKHLRKLDCQDLLPVLADSRLECSQTGEWYFRCICNSLQSGKANTGLLKLRRARTISDHVHGKQAIHARCLESKRHIPMRVLHFLALIVSSFSELKPSGGETSSADHRLSDLTARPLVAPPSVPTITTTAAKRHSHAAQSPVDLQTMLDAAFPGQFVAQTSDRYVCKTCVPTAKFSTSSSGDFAVNLARHLDSNPHKASVAARVGQQMLPVDMFHSSSPSASPVKHLNVKIHICKGYSSRKVTYYSRKFKTTRSADPMVLIYDAPPLPVIPEPDDDSIDLTVNSPEWIPHLHGRDEKHNYPHFTSRKCQGTWVEVMESTHRRDPEELWEICRYCTQIPFMPSFRKRIVRAYERIERGGAPRGGRVGTEAANHPTLRELYDSFPVVVKAFRQERRQKVYYMSLSHKLKQRLKHYERAGPEVLIVLFHHVV
jgi:hypothetical protein